MRGTVTLTLEVSIADEGTLREILDGANYEVAEEHGFGSVEGKTTVIVSRYYGAADPDAETQRRHFEEAESMLSKAGISFRHVSHGVIMGGGEGYSWKQLYFHDGRAAVRVRGAFPQDFEEARVKVASTLGVAPEELTFYPT
jgi:hypothetical protein